MARGNFNPDTWYFPVSISVPFDSSTILGWYLKFSVYVYGSSAYFVGITSIVTFLMGCFFYINAFVEHMQSIFDRVDAELEKVNSAGNKREEIEINSQMSGAVAFHMEIME